MIQTIRNMGALRNLLHGTALIFTLLLPFAIAPDYAGNWDLFFSGVLPATAPIIVIVIGLDMMMTQIWKSDASEEKLRHLNAIMKAHLIVGGMLLAAWLAVFLPALT